MKILVVDDHVLIRDALRSALAELKEVATVIEASDCRQTLQLIQEHPDLGLILLDLSLPDRDGFLLLAELRERYPIVSIVVLSAFHDRDNVVKALDLGAVGFISKSAQREVMLKALQIVFAGGIYIPPEILAHPRSRLPFAERKRVSPTDLGLTERQSEVLALMTLGKSIRRFAVSSASPSPQ